MSYRSLPNALAAIDNALNPPPSQPWAHGYVLCARPGCINLTFTWGSPYCDPECARRVASWVVEQGGRQDMALPEPPPVELTPDEQALRDGLAESMRRRRELLAVREADELVPESLDDADRRVLDVIAEREYIEVDNGNGWERIPGLIHTNTTPAQGLDALRYAIAAVNTAQRPADAPRLTGDSDSAATGPTEEQLAARAAVEHGVTTYITGAKPRPKPRPPWWRRLVRWLVGLLALVLLACSTVESGLITDKKWFDEYTLLVPIYTYDGKGQVTGFYLEEVYTPACWELFLRNGEDVGSRCIDPNEWMRYQIGDQYP